MPLPDLGRCFPDASPAGGHTEFGFQPCATTTTVVAQEVGPFLPATGADPSMAWLATLLIVVGAVTCRLARRGAAS